jgi:hypothetical protein
VATLVLAGSVARAAPAETPNDDRLPAARALFSEALADEQAFRFALALGKFEQVRTVRDTASVEYRIASCHEGLGEAPQAYTAYRAALLLARQDPEGTELENAATERLDALAKHVGRLTLRTPDPAPAEFVVRVDGAVVTPATFEPMALTPGKHVVVATAANVVPFRAEISLAEGSEASLDVGFDPRPIPTRETLASGGGRPAAVAGVIAISGGGALLAASAVLLVLREHDIATLNRACPGGLCAPGADAGDLESVRSRALFEGPAGVACGAAGIAAAGIGIVLVSVRRSAPSASRAPSLAPLVEPGFAGLAVAGIFR